MQGCAQRTPFKTNRGGINLLKTERNPAGIQWNGRFAPQALLSLEARDIISHQQLHELPSTHERLLSALYFWGSLRWFLHSVRRWCLPVEGFRVANALMCGRRRPATAHHHARASFRHAASLVFLEHAASYCRSPAPVLCGWRYAAMMLTAAWAERDTR